MRNKITVGGEPLEKKFPITTTETIYDNLVSESFEKNTSMNLIINKLLYGWVKKRQQKIKAK